MIEVNYPTAFLLLRTDSLHSERDTLQWEIYMVDEANNKSNTITTSSVYLSK
ncbi:MAG: hypothetical protein R2831_12670 [Chitinophagaceae bacterium]